MDACFFPIYQCDILFLSAECESVFLVHCIFLVLIITNVLLIVVFIILDRDSNAVYDTCRGVWYSSDYDPKVLITSFIILLFTGRMLGGLCEH